MPAVLDLVLAEVLRRYVAAQHQQHEHADDRRAVTHAFTIAHASHAHYAYPAVNRAARPSARIFTPTASRMNADRRQSTSVPASPSILAARAAKRWQRYIVHATTTMPAIAPSSVAMRAASPAPAPSVTATAREPGPIVTGNVSG